MQLDIPGTNYRRVYALTGWTVERKRRGWYYRKTDSDEEWRGPYGSAISVCLMVARNLAREVNKRDAKYAL